MYQFVIDSAVYTTRAIFWRCRLRRYLSSPGKLRHLVCLRITVHAKTRQGAGSERMVHEHRERYRGWSPGGGEGAGRGDVRMLRLIDERVTERERVRSLVASLCFISGNSGFATPEAPSLGSTRRNSATRGKSRSRRSPTLKSGNRADRQRGITTCNKFQNYLLVCLLAIIKPYIV